VDRPHVLPQVGQDFAALRTGLADAPVDHVDVRLEAETRKEKREKKSVSPSLCHPENPLGPWPNALPRLCRKDFSAVGTGLRAVLDAHVDGADVAVEVALLGKDLAALVALGRLVDLKIQVDLLRKRGEKNFEESRKKGTDCRGLPHLDVPVEGAGLGEDLAAVGTDDPVEAVHLLDVAVEVEDGLLVAAQGTRQRRRQLRQAVDLEKKKREKRGQKGKKG